MDSELNNYNINNADGVPSNIRDENKIVCNNENPRYIQENSLAGQKENISVSESFGSDKKSAVKENNAVSQSDAGQSRAASASSSASATSASASSAATSAATSVTSAIGGSVGALAGTVATAVMSAVIVVAAFVSTLVINLSLLMATTTSLVFNVELSGAQEEDFATPIYAVLTDGGDFYLQREITQDTTVISFEDLEAGKEYFITVKNEEKVFYSKSYCTPIEEVEKGEVFVERVENEFLLTVDRVNLKSGEYYTVTVKDEKGNVVFVKDATDSFAEYRFTVEAKELFISLAVNGSVCSVAQIDAEVPVIEYDYANPAWKWAEDFSSAEVTFREIHGGEPLVKNALVNSEITAEPSCGKEGTLTYTATFEEYTDTKTVAVPKVKHVYGEGVVTEPTCTSKGYTTHKCSVCGYEFVDTYVDELGHEFGVWEITTPATCTADGEETRICAHDSSHTETRKIAATGHTAGEWEIVTPATCTEKGLRQKKCTVCSAVVESEEINALGHDYREEITEPTCTAQGYTTRKCSRCEDAYIDTFVAALEHEYGEAVCEWTVDELSGGYTAQFVRTCVRGDDKIIYNAEVGSEVTAEPSCVTEGTLTYTATYGDYVDTKNEILPALEHKYAFNSFVWDGYTAQAKYVCANDGEHVVYYDAEITNDITIRPTCTETGVRTYTATYGDYVDTKNEILPAAGHAYGELIPENYNDNGLFAHYECSVCHSLFDAEKRGTTYDDLVITSGAAISLCDSALCINPNGYAGSESGLSNPTPFVSSATNPYLIKDQEVNWCDNIIQVYQNNSAIMTADVYIKLSNVTIQADIWCSLFLIKATNTLNIHLIIEGTVTFAGGSGQQIFSSQGSGSPTVNIIIDKTTAGGTFNAEVTSGLTYAETGSVNVRYV